MNAIHRLNSIDEYNVGSRFDLPPDWTYCDWNESLFPPTPLVKQYILNFLEEKSIQSYPDISNKQLIKKISEYTNLPQNFIEVYNGSDDALRDIFTTFVDEGKKVMSYQPSYSQVDTFIQTNTSFYKKNQITKPLSDHIYDFSCCEEYDVVYLINPNNPTGKEIKVNDIKNLISTFSKTLFVIDEAYFEYSGVTSSSLVSNYKNILITRTFSKAFGIASLRLGYVIGNPETLKDLKKIKNRKTVNSLAQIAGIACLSDIEYLNKCVNETKESINLFFNEVSKIKDYEVFKSSTNFILVKVPNVEEFIEKMKSKKIITRDRSYLDGLDGCVRLNLGPIALTKNIINHIKG